MAKDPTRKSSVLGPDGTPVQIARPGGQQGAPTSTGVRSVWTESVAAGLDPRKLAALLKAANAGDNHDFLVLAEEMEELIGAPDFADMVDDALDAIAKGYCAIEILRDTAADRWTPAGYTRCGRAGVADRRCGPIRYGTRSGFEIGAGASGTACLLAHLPVLRRHTSRRSRARWGSARGASRRSARRPSRVGSAGPLGGG